MLSNVAKHINKTTKSNNRIIVKENRKGEVIRFVANITLAKEKIGFKPKIKLEEGIKKTMKWYSQR